MGEHREEISPFPVEHGLQSNVSVDIGHHGLQSMGFELFPSNRKHPPFPDTLQLLFPSHRTCIVPLIIPQTLCLVEYPFQQQLIPQFASPHFDHALSSPVHSARFKLQNDAFRPLVMLESIE